VWRRFAENLDEADDAKSSVDTVKFATTDGGRPCAPTVERNASPARRARQSTWEMPSASPQPGGARTRRSRPTFASAEEAFEEIESGAFCVKRLSASDVRRPQPAAGHAAPALPTAREARTGRPSSGAGRVRDAFSAASSSYGLGVYRRPPMPSLPDQRLPST